MPDQHALHCRELLRGHDTPWGIFYPTDHLIVILASPGAAERARQALLAAGFTDAEVDTVPADDVIRDVEAGTHHTGFLARVRQQMARMFGSEADLWEDDVELARDGAGFLLVRCVSEGEGRRVLGLLPERPIRMRRYGRLSVHDLVT